MKKKLAIACLGLGAVLLLLLPAVSQAAPAQVGSVTVVEGKAFITHKGESAAKAIKIGTPVYQDDMIKTEADGRVRVVFIDQSIISVGGNSSMTINEYVFDPKGQVRTSRLSLSWGKVKCYVNDFMGYRSKKFNVATNTTIVGVRGTVFMVWMVDGQVTKVVAFENIVDVASLQDPDKFVELNAGMMTDINGQGAAPTTPVLMDEATYNALMNGMLPEDRAKIDFSTSGATETTTTTTTTSTSTSTTTSTTSSSTSSTTTSTSTSTTLPPSNTLPGFPSTPIRPPAR